MSIDLENTLLAVLFALGEPVSPERIADALQTDPETARRLLGRLGDLLDGRGDALQLLSLDGQYQLATREKYTPVIRRALIERRNAALSPAALEVLAAVAYNQPVTRAYVEQVRGVDSSVIVSSLVDKGLLEEAGRLELPGRPITYKTTAHFLRTFGLKSLDDLPTVLPREAAGEQEPDTGQLEGQTGLSDPGE
jgi:segregation and condensation protein B